ncbi:hypothetical protein [Methylobacterium sp. ARG-1]|uniref:hypothetical protein n=1 Tax=Methylobacterium sp. ARG-1 TaxID=1692501 RepID=UPI000681AE30|nr:hypothetical protein [Methylobacterium sp. ARG-1]KNY20875.1 hypothetical protein AKJ13_19715 [Methylobacterium sp. ARG-1]
MFITAAHAQTAEAIKAALEAGDILLQYKVLGAVCVILGLAIAFLFWKLDRLSTSIMREVVTALQANTAATVAGNLTITALTTTLEATDDGVEKLSHQTELAAQAAASRGVEILKNQEEIKRRLEGRLP